MGRGMQVAAGLAFGWTLACGGTGDAPPEAPREEAPEAVAASVAPAPAPAAPAASEAVLTGVQAGDAACYLELQTGGGEPKPVPADFELCPGGAHDASGLVGSKVALTTKPTQVIAASCGGDPECKDHETVDLVVGLTVLASSNAADPSTCPVDALEAALRDSEVAQAVNSTKLQGVKCTLTWATALTVPPPDSDGAVVLFMRSAKGPWVATNAGTGGVCDEVPEADRAGLDCD